MQAISRRSKTVFSPFTEQHLRILDPPQTMSWPGHWEAGVYKEFKGVMDPVWFFVTSCSP